MNGSAPPLLFSAARLRFYPLALLTLCVVFEATLLGSSTAHVDHNGTPVGGDFMAFYAASKLTLSGEPAAVFDLTRLAAAEHEVAPGSQDIFQWAYPPTYQLLIAPLA